MKRGASQASEDEPAHKQAVTYETFKKWRTDLDREHHAVSWLNYDTISDGGKRIVTVTVMKSPQENPENWKRLLPTCEAAFHLMMLV